MKDIAKVASAIVLICLISSTSYSRGIESGRESGYRRGYDAGVSDTRFEFEKEKERFVDSAYDAGHLDGFIFGKQESSDHYRYILEDAIEYAEDQTGCDLYDALRIVWAYAGIPDEQDRIEVSYDAMVETVYHFASRTYNEFANEFNLY